MKLYIDVEDSSGVKQGPGPIYTATQWRNTRRLNRAGTFAATVPAGATRLASVGAKTILSAWGLQHGDAPTYLGAGVVDSQRLSVSADVSMVDIAGDDLLRELVNRTVGFLSLRDLVQRTPTKIWHNDDPAGANTYTAKTDPFTVTLTSDDYLYVGDSDPFSILRLVIGATPNIVEATLDLEYWDGSAWTALDIEDGTYTAACTLRQSGDIEFERLLNWATKTVNGTSAYWVRLQASKDLTAAVTVTSLATIEELPVSDALDQIMAYAPAGWSLDAVNGYSATSALVYAKFAGESVLGALIKVAEAIGENFILGSGRRVIWLRDDVRDSGVRAVGHVDPIAAEDNTEIVRLASLERVTDSYDLMTRIYPYGGGNANNRLKLTQANWSAPANYTLSTGGNYIESDVAAATYGRIERALTWKDIAPIHNTVADERMAANMLAQAAYEQLSRSDTPQVAYRATVMGTRSDRPLWPGYTIRVDYHEWRAGYHAVDVRNQDLWILEVTEELGPDGMHPVSLVLATVDRWPASDGSVNASTMESGRIYEAHAQGTMAYSVAGPYIRRLDSTHTAEFTCRIGREVTDLEYARLRFKTTPLRSSIYTVTGSSSTSSEGGGATVTSASGGGTTVTSAAGGGATVTSASGGGTTVSSSTDTPESGANPVDDTSYDGTHDHDGDTGSSSPADPHSHSIISEGSHQHTLSHTHWVEHSHSVTVGDHTHGVTISNHTHGVTVGNHTHDVTVDDHSHNVTPNITTTYGIYEDNRYPSGISVAVDGVDVTSAIGGPWATAEESVEVEADITAYISAAPGGLRQRHRIVISCTGGRGEVEAEVDVFVAVQAISMD